MSNQIVLSILGVLIVVAISMPLAKNLSKQYKVNKEITQLSQEINDLDGKNEELKNLIDYLETDQFTDQQARLNLNYKKNGENVLVIKSKDDNYSSDDLNNSIKSLYKINNTKEVKNKEVSNPLRWWNYFLKS